MAMTTVEMAIVMKGYVTKTSVQHTCEREHMSVCVCKRTIMSRHVHKSLDEARLETIPL